jgi:hypothetical protein
MPFEKANSNCANRAAEWMCALAMVGIGLIVIVVGHLFSIKTIGAFREFAKYGLSDSTTALLFVAVGISRMYALKRNGTWKHGPLIRAACAFVGVMIWSTLLWGVIHMLTLTHDLYISMGAWFAFLCGEMYSFGRAILDEKPPKKVKADGATGLC